MARLLLGVSGGIAAYKALELVRLATRAGHAVRVLQTEASLRFVGRASFEALTGAPVLVSEWEVDPARGAFPGDPVPDAAPISHLALVERADVYLVAPASANTLAKLSLGLADNLLTNAALAAACPVAVAPAMNDRMYAHPATRESLDRLRARGVTVIDPGEGALASRGEHGLGRLPEPAELLTAAEALTAGGRGGPLDGLRVLVTAGGTREPIDAVRFVGNRSSGRMGLALAAEAVRRGAEVTVVAASVALPSPPGVAWVPVETAAELAHACQAAWESTDVLLMAAAVADFRPAAPAATKIKKAGGPPPPLALEATEDVLSGLAARRRAGQILVGFAAEHGDGALDHARGKLAAKGLDAVVLNDIARTDIAFDSTHNEVVVLTAEGERHVPRTTKAVAASAVLDAVASIRSAASPRTPSDGAHAPGPARRAARV